MGLFQRNSINEETKLYELVDPASIGGDSGSKTVLVVGLGNMGKEYVSTRHNIGFEVLDYFAEKNNFPGWTTKKDLLCHETSNIVGGTRVILCKPTTFMNESGQAVQAMQRFYKIPNSSCLIVHDELDIAFGQIRTRMGGSSAGHNGIKSVTNQCGEDYLRLRIGIGPKRPSQIDSADFVLAKFSKTQEKSLGLLLIEANSMLSEYAFSKGVLADETRSFLI